MKLIKSGTIQIVISSACFGALPLLTKISYNGGANVVTILAIRFAIASLLIWAYLFWTRTEIKVSIKEMVVFAFMGICGYGVMAATYFSSLHYIPSSMAAMIMFIYPVLVTYLSAYLLKSPITKEKIIALIMVFLGALAITSGKDTTFHLTGILLAFTSALFYAFYIVYLGSTYTYQKEPEVLTAFIILFSALFFTLYGIIKGDLNLGIDLAAWIAIIVMAVISTVIAIMLFYAGVQKIGPSIAAIISTVEPVTALLLGIIILGENFNLNQLLGAVLIIAGVIYVRLQGLGVRLKGRPKVKKSLST